MKHASEMLNGVMTYEFVTKNKKIVAISMEDEIENPQFKIKGPKEIISKVVAGLGEENETEAWVTEKHLKTEAQRMFAVLEIAIMAQRGEL
jgi:hypothetical protein